MYITDAKTCNWDGESVCQDQTMRKASDSHDCISGAVATPVRLSIEVSQGADIRCILAQQSSDRILHLPIQVPDRQSYKVPRAENHPSACVKFVRVYSPEEHIEYHRTASRPI